jgi:hypothetical protein
MPHGMLCGERLILFNTCRLRAYSNRSRTNESGIDAELEKVKAG